MDINQFELRDLIEKYRRLADAAMTKGNYDLANEYSLKALNLSKQLNNKLN